MLTGASSPRTGRGEGGRRPDEGHSACPNAAFDSAPDARSPLAASGENRADALDLGNLFRDLASSRGLLLAVSGGPDSTALLLLIDRWRAGRAVPVTVATVDHRLREGSAAEATAVAALCRARGLRHRILVREGPAPTTGLQAFAREARYDLLAACAKEIGADAIVTGHHADDQAETILMRLTRGSGPAGLAGMMAMSQRTGLRLARPLLGIPKASLIAICREDNVDVADDPSNRADRFRRTGLRQLMPILEREGLDGPALLRLGARAERAEAALRWSFDRMVEMREVARTPDESAIPLLAFAALPDEFAVRLVEREIVRLMPDARPRLDRLERLVSGLHAEPQRRATLGECLVFATASHLVIARAPPRRRT